MSCLENILVCIGVPFLLALLFVKGKQREYISFILCGMVMCLLASYVTSFFMAVYGANTLVTAVEITPVCEEVLKFLPFLLWLFIFEPEEGVQKETEKRMQEEAEKQKLLEELKGKENVTPDGRKINIYANIGSVGDLGYVMENDAGGIGLFRSEFLYLGRNDFPTEEEQFQAYKQAVQTMAGKKVIIRTLDIGADKQVDYFNLGKEENPALGYRAIRICLKQPEIFKAQLRALFRAAVYGNLSVMYPMITSTEEVEKIYAIVAEVEEELKAQEVQYKIPEQGIMIETPAAVMISDRLAKMVDFFSIGTNDLTQYTLAIDRQNEQLDDFYNPHHEAVLRMIRMVVENAHKCGKWAGICGELGADLTLTEQFVRMGVDELSVAPSMILKLRKIVREMKAEE